ncbi:MAG TPA: hypothetical protein VME41_17075 [Stellaceae bacterium]|nr:hypothetical protein [Stellaceae bacterium]
MLTKPLTFGLNLISLGGFLLMGLTLTLSRQRRIGAGTAAVLMGVGTALLFGGLYVAAPSN